MRNKDMLMLLDCRVLLAAEKAVSRKDWVGLEIAVHRSA
jgi:hypothetical protein